MNTEDTDSAVGILPFELIHLILSESPVLWIRVSKFTSTTALHQIWKTPLCYVTSISKYGRYCIRTNRTADLYELVQHRYESNAKVNFRLTQRIISAIANYANSDTYQVCQLWFTYDLTLLRCRRVFNGACRRGELGIVRSIILWNEDPKVIQKGEVYWDGIDILTGLHQAIKHNHIDVTQYILAAGRRVAIFDDVFRNAERTVDIALSSLCITMFQLVYQFYYKYLNREQYIHLLRGCIGKFISTKNPYYHNVFRYVLLTSQRFKLYPLAETEDTLGKWIDGNW